MENFNNSWNNEFWKTNTFQVFAVIVTILLGVIGYLIFFR